MTGSDTQMLIRSEITLECHTKNLDFILYVLGGTPYSDDSNRLPRIVHFIHCCQFKTLN